MPDAYCTNEKRKTVSIQKVLDIVNAYEAALEVAKSPSLFSYRNECDRIDALNKALIKANITV